MSDRPADIILPEGWTWDRVEAERARWEVSPDMVPDAVVPGNVTGWCTIAWYRWHRDHVPAGEVFAVSDRAVLRHRAPLYLNEDLLGRLLGRTQASVASWFDDQRVQAELVGFHGVDAQGATS